MPFPARNSSSPFSLSYHSVMVSFHHTGTHLLGCVCVKQYCFSPFILVRKYWSVFVIWIFFLFVRSVAYDASLSACLVALYGASHSGTIERTAQTLLNILPQAIKHSPSLELKVGGSISVLSQIAVKFFLALCLL